MMHSCVWNGASGSTADSVNVSLRLLGHEERDTQTPTEHGRAPVDTDVAVAAEKLGLRALDHSALRLDLHELLVLGHGERDTQTPTEHGRAPDVTVAAERLGLRALVHSTPRFDVRELFLLEHGETDSHA